MDEDLQKLSKDSRAHRDSTKQDVCWHHPGLWGLLLEPVAPDIAIPEWPRFLRGCLKYRESLDAQRPDAPRIKDDYTPKA